jgi:two-component system cell cycle sensor histidine kinase/response regulator CckA
MQAVIETPLVILDTIPEAYIRLDSDYRFTFVNQAAQRHLGVSRSQLIGKRFQEVYSGKGAENALRRAVKKRAPITMEMYCVIRQKWSDITVMPDATGGIVMRLADVCERQLEESHSRLHAIASNLPGFVFQTYVRDNGETGVSFADKRAFEIFGIDPEPLETCYRRFVKCIAPEDLDRYKAAAREATSTGHLEFEGRFITPAGEEKYIRAVSRSRRSGNETLHDGIVLDITEHRRAELALRESQELYRQIFEVECDALVMVDNQSGGILAANPAAEELYGYSRKELLSMNRVDLSSEPEATVRATLAKTRFIPLRWHRKKDGTVFPVEISGRYFDWRGSPVFVSAIRDITGRTEMEEALRKSEEKFSKAFYSNPAAMVIGDRETRVWLEVNHTFEKLLGRRREDLIGHRSDEFDFWVDPSDRDKASALLDRDGSLCDWEFRFRKKNGEIATGLLSVEPIEIEGRACAISSVVDITERLHLESQLRQAQKLESLGRLAGGVAHDFNNLLTVINGYSDLILHSVDSHDPLHLSAEAIKKAGERAASLTQQLLAFSRKQIIKSRPLDMNAIVTDSQRMLQRLIAENIQLTTDLDSSLGRVMSDPDQISQVIMNLVVNARDAMPGGGTLEIATRNVDVDESHVASHGDALPGKYVLMSVTDSGIGMDEKTMQSAFEPFFTTKEPGKGTGLGLSTVQGIVRQSGGWIEVQSEIGKGSTFDIYLPRMDAVPAPERAAPAPAEAPRGGETVLVVEDDNEIRQLTKSILTAQGYHVLEASNSGEALLLESEYAGEIHLILTDLVLPGMNGKALYDRLRVLRPNVKVLFTSGYAPDVFAGRGLEQQVAYLPKPFDTQSLTAKVREVLAEKQSGGDHS